MLGRAGNQLWVKDWEAYEWMDGKFFIIIRPQLTLTLVPECSSEYLTTALKNNSQNYLAFTGKQSPDSVYYSHKQPYQLKPYLAAPALVVVAASHWMLIGVTRI